MQIEYKLTDFNFILHNTGTMQNAMEKLERKTRKALIR